MVSKKVEELLLLQLVVFVAASSYTAGSECRKMFFRGKVEGKALIGHLLATHRVPNDDACQVRCYGNKRCVSFNVIRPDDGSKMLNCNLSSADSREKPEYFKAVLNSSYFGLKHNPCWSNPCKHGGTCGEVGFESLGYKCFCRASTTGMNCETDVDECAQGTHSCLSKYHKICVNTFGSYNCLCKKGFYLVRGSCYGNGSSAEVATRTCRHQKNQFPASTSGLYWIKPQEDSAYQVYCEMETDRGAWTLVWSYCFTKYHDFKSPDNILYPYPQNLTRCLGCRSSLISDTIPLNETDFNAMNYLQWRKHGKHFLIKSNINNWISCLDKNRNLVFGRPGGVTCKIVKSVVPNCNVVPSEVTHGCGPALTTSNGTYYKFDVCGGWPVHDPCGRSEENHLKNMTNPHGNLFVRYDY